MENRHYHIFANGKRIEIPSPQVWEYVGDQDKPIKQIVMKNKKHKVQISKDKVVIKPTPGHEIDEDLICKINRHYEHDGIFKPIKKELPKTWEELGEIQGYFIDSTSNIQSIVSLWTAKSHKNMWPTKELAKAALALSQLCQLKDRYNDGWVPDWEDENEKYDISVSKGKIVVGSSFSLNKVLAFRFRGLRDEFLSNFAELIETAKPLL